MPVHHALDPSPDTVHWGYFDAALPPRLTVDPGDTVTVDTVSGGLVEVADPAILRPAHRAIVETLRPVLGPHILTGPIAVRGAEPGDTLEVRIESIEPREFGGNIDNKELVPGTSLFLPVFVPGANFSAGDGHAVQGDGEVCLTALETCLTGTFALVLHKGRRLAFPRAVTPTHYIAMGMDPDLDDAAKQALRDMIAWLVELKGWSPADAYVFCSLACDLRVTQLVDGNKGVHAMVSRGLLDPPAHTAPTRRSSAISAGV